MDSCELDFQKYKNHIDMSLNVITSERPRVKTERKI